MSDTHIHTLLNALEKKPEAANDTQEISIYISDSDLIRLQALAEVFDISIDELGTSLLHTVLGQVEEKLPYRAGSKVIRVEDDEPIYEDVGPTPRYLEIKERLLQKKQAACA